MTMAMARLTSSAVVVPIVMVRALLRRWRQRLLALDVVLLHEFGGLRLLQLGVLDFVEPAQVRRGQRKVG